MVANLYFVLGEESTRALDEVKFLRLLQCTCLPRRGERRAAATVPARPLATWAPYAIALSSLWPLLIDPKWLQLGPISFSLRNSNPEGVREKRDGLRSGAERGRERESALREENSHEPRARAAAAPPDADRLCLCALEMILKPMESRGERERESCLTIIVAGRKSHQLLSASLKSTAILSRCNPSLPRSAPCPPNPRFPVWQKRRQTCLNVCFCLQGKGGPRPAVLIMQAFRLPFWRRTTGSSSLPFPPSFQAHFKP